MDEVVPMPKSPELIETCFQAVKSTGGLFATAEGSLVMVENQPQFHVSSPTVAGS